MERGKQRGGGQKGEAGGKKGEAGGSKRKYKAKKKKETKNSCAPKIFPANS